MSRSVGTAGAKYAWWEPEWTYREEVATDAWLLRTKMQVLVRVSEVYRVIVGARRLPVSTMRSCYKVTQQMLCLLPFMTKQSTGASRQSIKGATRNMD